MRRKLPFWTVILILCATWLLASWAFQAHVEATRSILPSLPRLEGKPLRQDCTSGPDLRIQGISVEPDPPGVDQSYNIHVEIVNAGNVDSTADTWTYLYADRTPSGPPDVQAHAPTGGLASGASIMAHFTLTQTHAAAGWHTVSVLIDALNELPEPAACNGENNNNGAISFEILQVYTPTPTVTPPPTATPFPKPEIYLFSPDSATVARGDPITLQWQVYGEAVTVFLDGQLVPLEDTRVLYPQSSHVYTLRAENPGGAVSRTSNISVVQPTATATATATPCQYATIHEFDAIPLNIIRGATTMVFWDVSGATEVYLNGHPEVGVSQKQFKLDQTTVFVLMARNVCGDIEQEITVHASYATPTFTLTPTATSTPTRTPIPTSTPFAPTPTPTRRVLATLTQTPVGTPSTASATGTVTPTTTGAATGATPGTGTPTPTETLSPFDSPLNTPPPVATSTPTEEPTRVTALSTSTAIPTWTAVETPTEAPSATAAATATATATATAAATASATAAPDTPTPTAEPTQVAALPTSTATAMARATTATPAATAAPPLGTFRMYLCPLGILLVFAVAVLVMSIILPRLQKRDQALEGDATLSSSLPREGPPPLQ